VPADAPAPVAVARPRALVAPERNTRVDAILVFVFTIAIAIASLPHRSAYPNGDSVEYLRNADRVESGLSLPEESVRPFFFSALLLPIFRAARAFGSTDGREVVAVATALMIAVAGLAAVATHRFATRIFGAGPALGAALFLAANRTFQFWAPTVTTDVPCALFLACASAVALGPPSVRRALALGALLGAAFLFKYQALLPAGILVACLPVLWRGATRKTRLYGSIALGLAIAILVQSSLDGLAGRPFGSTFVKYLRDNVLYLVLGRVHPLLRKLFGDTAVKEWTESVFGIGVNLQLKDSLPDDAALLRPRSWYWKNLREFLTPLEVALGAIGLVAALRKRSRAWWLPGLVVAIAAVTLSMKGSKEFRLWIPFSPFVFALVGLGFASTLAWIDRTARPLAATAAILLLAPNVISIVGGLPLQMRLARTPFVRSFLAFDASTIERDQEGLLEARRGWRPWQLIPEPENAAQFGGYERAARWLNRYAPSGSRVSAAWAWQLAYRLRPDLFFVEHGSQLDRYPQLDAAGRAGVLAHVRSLDFLVSHFAALVLAPDLFETIDREFETVAVIEDPIYDQSLDAILLLRRRPQPAAAGEWMRVLTGAEAEAFRANAPADRRLLFYARRLDDKDAPFEPFLELLDCQIDRATLAEGRLQLRLAWRIPEPDDAGAFVLEGVLNHRIRVQNGRGEMIGVDGFYLGHRRLTPEQWKPGVVILEQMPIRPERDYFDFVERRSPNEELSFDVWIELVPLLCDRLGRPERLSYAKVIPYFERNARWKHPTLREHVRIGGIDFTPEPEIGGR